MDSKWSNPNNEKGENFRNVLQTDIVVNIDNYLFGERDDNQAIVRIDKGEDENTIVSSDGYPDFKVNEKVLLFLSRDDSDIATDEDYYVLTGMRQGKYDLSESENSRSSDTINTYISSMEVDNERDTEVIDELKDKIEKEHNLHPNYSEVSLKDMEDVIRKAKDALYTFTSTEESRTTTVTETNTDPKTGKVTVTETEVTEIWKIYIAVCGTGGAGKTFLILLMALRMRRMVIMAPEMVRVISPDPSVCKTCKVYLLTMQFTTSWDSGCITELYADYDMARFAMLKGIREEQAEGCIKDWADRDALEEEYCTDFYEAWHRDEYSEKHFTASIEKLSLTLPQRIIEAE